MATTEELLAKMAQARMGVNPYVSIGAPIAGNIISALVSQNARRRAQERLSGLQRPSLPQFRQNPLLSQRIAQQQQLADQPMMGYQRAMDEQTARQMERGRQIAAGLGGGAGLAYMQGVSSNAAALQRQGLLSDMDMQARNRAELDQLINMRNQEMQQQREMEGMEYQLGMQDYIRQREGLEADLSQQTANIGAAIGASVADIPAYVQNYRMYNAMRDLKPIDAETITPMTPIGTPGSVGSPVPNPLLNASPSYIATPLLTRNEMTYAPPIPAMDMLPAMPIERPDPYSSYVPSRILSQQAASAQPQLVPIQRADNPLEAAMMSRLLGFPRFYSRNPYSNQMPEESYIPYIQTQSPVFRRR